MITSYSAAGTITCSDGTHGFTFAINMANNSIVSLKELPFSCRSYKDKLAIKLLQPPRPKLIIKRVCKKVGKRTSADSPGPGICGNCRSDQCPLLLPLSSNTPWRQRGRRLDKNRSVSYASPLREGEETRGIEDAYR